MRPKSIKDLGASVGDIVVCVSEDTCMFSNGVEYEVELLDGKLALMTDCGFYATSSASLFQLVNVTADTTEQRIVEAETHTTMHLPMRLQLHTVECATTTVSRSARAA